MKNKKDQRFVIKSFISTINLFYFRGFFEVDTCRAAIKQIQKHYIEETDFTLAEIEVLSRCKHDNIIKYFGFVILSK